MKDIQIKGTGNSRFLRTSLPEGTTWEEALALFRAGQLPVDFAGFNSEGITVMGTPFTKANLLSETTVEALELEQTDPTVDNALYALSQKTQPAVLTVNTVPGASVSLVQGETTLVGTADSNGTLILYPNSLGDWTLTCSYAGTTWGQTVSINYIGLISVTAAPTLEQCSWAFINTISQNGAAAKTFKVGDKKTVAIGGVNYQAVIIGFDHDNLTTAASGRTTAGITFQLENCLNTTYQMNSSNTNSGGWSNCAMRNTVMANQLTALPSALRSVVKAVNKLTSAGNQSTTINTTSDRLFLLSEIEIFGTITHSKSGEGKQYDYYKAGNSRVKTVNGSASHWWERSPYGSDAAYFCRVGSSGGASGAGAVGSCGVSFGFCV